MAAISDKVWPATQSQWRALVDKALKGADIDGLTSTTSDGLPVQPLYPSTTAAALRSRRGPWCLFQRVDQSEPAAANGQALDDLMNGAGGLELVFKTSPWAWFDGLELSLEALKRSLDGIDLSLIRLRLEAGAEGDKALDLLHRLAGDQGLAMTELRVTGGHDVAGLSSYGLWPEDKLSDKLSRLPAFDGRYWHAAGASPAQEVSLVLASLVAALRQGEVPATSHTVTLVAEADQFATIAKFRAWRLLLGRLGELLSDDPMATATLSQVTLHGETAWRDLTRADTSVNILRGTTAALSAAVAGVDSLTVLAHTAALGIAAAAPRRLARNIQSILMEEASLAMVADPAAGSGGLDATTDDLAARAWQLFQQLEGAGGIRAACDAGLPQGWINEAKQVRHLSLATRKTALVGSNRFADLAVVTDVEERAPAARSAGARFCPAQKASLRPSRLSAPFEDLHQRAKGRSARAGVPPQVFLAPLSALPKITAQAAFAEDLFQACGLSASRPIADVDPSSVVSAFQQAATPLACLIGADADLARAADLRERLMEAGAEKVFLVVSPSLAPAHFPVSDCIHDNSNVLALGETMLDLLEVKMPQSNMP